MYTRAQLARHYNISQSKLRRVLRALQITPDKIVNNSRGLPVYYYQDFVIQEINRYLQALKQKLQKQQKKCSICKKKVPVSSMVGTRCIDCFVKKSCVPIVYGNSFWEKLVQTPVIQKAVQYLKQFIPGPR